MSAGDGWVRVGRLLFVVAMGALLCACASRVRTAPQVVDGVLDLRDWDVERDGPVALEGEWRVAMGEPLPARVLALNAEDSVRVPWSTVHQRSRSGADVDEARWLVLIAKIRTERAAALTFPYGSPLRFHVRCEDARGVQDFGDTLAATPVERAFRGPATRPEGHLRIEGETKCAMVMDAADSGHVRIAVAPRIEAVAEAPARKAVELGIVVVELVNVVFFGAFSLVLYLTNRNDAASRVGVLLALFQAIRVVLIRRGLLVGTAACEHLPWIFNDRLQLVAFAGMCVTLGRFGDAVGEYSSEKRRPLEIVFVSVAVMAILLPLSWVWMYALRCAQVALVVTVGWTLARLWAKRSEPAIAMSLVGFAITASGVLWNTISHAVSGSMSPFVLTVATAGPFFQLAAVGIRASEARAKSASLEVSNELLDAMLAERTVGRDHAMESLALTNRGIRRFVPTEFLHELGHDDVTRVQLGEAAARHATILFADIRNFTAISERMSPAETFAFLNACLSRIGPHVRGNHGFVDKYIGDAIMALFLRRPSDAVRAALAMQREVVEANRRHPERPPLLVGVGIHAGDVMMGTIGEAERFEATVISDAVNLSARLESLTKQLGCTLLVSGDVFASMDDDLRVHSRRLGSFVVKGKAKPVELFELYGSDGEELRRWKDASSARFEAMLEAFAEGAFEPAIELAGALRDEMPEDGPVNWWFLRLIQEFHASGDLEAPPSSKGVVVLDAK